jgi:hypothetical protein
VSYDTPVDVHTACLVPFNELLSLHLRTICFFSS